ncbi:hypothetical protein J2W28_004310 [Variovorax boronicumulans]|nr:hypothetical protein [Variovorax boronicumulans]
MLRDVSRCAWLWPMAVRYSLLVHPCPPGSTFFGLEAIEGGRKIRERCPIYKCRTKFTSRFIGALECLSSLSQSTDSFSHFADSLGFFNAQGRDRCYLPSKIQDDLADGYKALIGINTLRVSQLLDGVAIAK